MAYLKLMMDEKEIAHLSEDGQYLCANESVPQYDLPLNLFIGSNRKVPVVDVVVWAKKRIFPRNRMDCKEILEMMGLPDYNAWEIVKRTDACLMEDPFWLRLRIPPAAGQGKLWLNIKSLLMLISINLYQPMDTTRSIDWNKSPIYRPYRLAYASGSHHIIETYCGD